MLATVSSILLVILFCLLWSYHHLYNARLQRCSDCSDCLQYTALTVATASHQHAAQTDDTIHTCAIFSSILLVLLLVRAVWCSCFCTSRNMPTASTILLILLCCSYCCYFYQFTAHTPSDAASYMMLLPMYCSCFATAKSKLLVRLYCSYACDC